jgi:hypothetical protein
MNHANSDAWYVRLPDSNVVRANSTRSVRHHIETGTIPPGSLARRSHRETWTPLYRLEPFADLLANYPGAGHGDADGSRGAEHLLQLQAVGVRGLVTELVNALDSTLTRRKLLVAFAACLVFGLLLLVQDVALIYLAPPWVLAGALAQGLIALITAALCTSLLTQLTFVELSQLRPARLREAAQDLSGHALRLFVCYLVVVGSVVAVLYLVQWLPGWLLDPAEDAAFPGREYLALGAVVVQILLDVVLLPLLGFALLLGPIVVIEEASVLRSLRQWAGMIRTHLRRLFLYESLAAAVALVACLPFVVPVAFAAQNAPWQGTPGVAARATVDLLLGLAATPAVAYLTVANVFIYLNLRYELPAGR